MGRKRYTFWIDDEQAAALKQIKTRDGVPESEQLRRAIAAWIATRKRRLKLPGSPMSRARTPQSHQPSR